MLKIGDNAPEFTLASDGGKQLSLKDFKGRRVLLFFFPKPTPRVERSKRPSFVTQKRSSISSVSPFSEPVPTR